MSPILKPEFLSVIRLKCDEGGVKITDEQIKAVFEAMIWAQQRLQSMGGKS